jgi:hypothetical protein
LREYVPDGSDGIGAGYALLRHVQFMDAAHFVHAVLGHPGFGEGEFAGAFCSFFSKN